MRISRKRRIAAAAVVAIAAAMNVAASATSASAYTPAPPMHANQTPAHVCKVIGQSPDNPGEGYEAVVCVDLWTVMEGGHAYATSRIEAICQTLSGSPVTCTQVDVDGQLWNALSGNVGNSGSGAHCGAYYGNSCSSTRNYYGSGAWGPSNGSCTSEANEVWAIAKGGTVGEEETRIQLPPSPSSPYGYIAYVNLSNISSGHYVICP